MRKFIAIFLSAALCLSLTSCKRKPQGGITDDPNVTNPASPPTIVEIPEIEDPTVDEPFPSYGFCTEWEQTEYMKRLGHCFSLCPEEFTDSTKLSDEALFFAAVNYLSSEFTLSDDGFTATLPLSRLKSGVREIFGERAGFSAQFAQKDYSPYMVDAESGSVLGLDMGGGFDSLYPWAIVETGIGEYELWMLCLADPLFSADEANRETFYMGGAAAIPIETLIEYAKDMQTAVFGFKTSGENLILCSFRYVNYKYLDNFAV